MTPAEKYNRTVEVWDTRRRGALDALHAVHADIKMLERAAEMAPRSAAKARDLTGARSHLNDLRRELADNRRPAHTPEEEI